MKSPSSVIGDGDTMVLPDMAASVFEGEAEFAVVIGKKASNVKAKDAMKYVFGYTNFIGRFGARRGAADQRVLSDEVARHVSRRSGRTSSPPTRSRIRTSCRSC